ncbi:MAG: AAA family ATPase, partial [Pseudomonadota bacterium]|nr:AAA family ATPase [Pseudomonadota bacterium]
KQEMSVFDLSNLFFAVPLKDKEFYISIFENLSAIEVKDPESAVAFIHGITTNRLLREVSLEAYEASEGRKDVGGILTKLKEIEANQEAVNNPQGGQEDFEFVSDDLEVLLNEQRSKPGLRWRLAELNKMLGSLRKGDFGFIFARPETGKTTFLASEVTFMAEQSENPILWFNNEEQGQKVMLRNYQASLGITDTELFLDIPGNRQKFLDRTHGRIKMLDRAQIHYKDVEKLCELHQPALIIFDQIDKIKGFDNDREDLRLGSIYIWARELAKKYCPVIGVCQADGSGEGAKWLTMANVSNAKTSKQAEADWILGIGKVNDVGFDNIRFIYASKNKLVGDQDSDPTMRHGRVECLIHPTIARYGSI